MYRIVESALTLYRLLMYILMFARDFVISIVNKCILYLLRPAGTFVPSRQAEYSDGFFRLIQGTFDLLLHKINSFGTSTENYFVISKCTFWEKVFLDGNHNRICKKQKSTASWVSVLFWTQNQSFAENEFLTKMLSRNSARLKLDQK